VTPANTTRATPGGAEPADVPGDGARIGSKVDGRTARAERTRTAIVDAQLRLIRDGDLRPTADRIAKAAGVSLRALWSHFADMEALFAASGRRVLAERDAAYAPIPAGLPLAGRIDAFCRQRARLLEMLAPTARASALIEPFSATLQRYRRLHVARVRSEVLATFGPEVGEDAVLVDALTAVSLWPAWATWRDAMELTVDASLAALHRSLTALLAGR
jgi:TetR/AcrR family transcriptional regulator of autoinduction and epiphytic fitness